MVTDLMFKNPLRRLALSSGLCAVLLLALAAVVWLDNSVNRGVTFDAARKPIPWSDGPQLGVNAFNLQAEPHQEVVTRTLELARDLGARYVRMQVPWEDIEIHGKGDFVDRRNDINGDGTPDPIDAWAKYDRIVATARSFGLELIMRVERPPRWARAGFDATEVFQQGLHEDGNSTGPPDNFADYGDFMRALVSRYRGEVRLFQVWNEPNLRVEWNWQDPKPEDFVKLLHEGATAAREANPDAVILFPSLSPTDGLDKRAPISDLDYLDRVYDAGGGAYFDIMSGQSYGLGQPPEEHRYVRLRNRGDWNWARPIDTRNDVSRIVLLHEVMERHGDGDKAVWIGEFGWNSAPDSVPPERRFTWGEPVSEETKAEYIIGQMERARAEWPWIGVMNVWMLRWGGSVPDPADPTPYFAIVDQHFQPLPAYNRIKEYIAQQQVAGVGYRSWSSWARPDGDGQSVRFAGTRLELDLPEGSYRVSLDGGAPIDLQGGGIMPVADKLADGVHTLHVAAEPPSAQPNGLLVSRARPMPWFWNTAPLLLAGLLALACAATAQALFESTDIMIIRTTPARRRLLAWLQTKRGDWVVLLAMLLALVLFYRASTMVPITLLGAALFGALALLRPDLALRFVPLTVPLFFIPKGIWDASFGIRGDGLRLPLHEVVLLITLAATIMRWLYDHIQDWRSVIGDWKLATENWRQNVLTSLAPVALFLLAGTLGVVFAQSGGRGAALREWRWLIVEPLIFFALLLVDERRRAKDENQSVGASFPIITSFLIGGALVGLLGILQFLGLNLVPLFGTKVGFSEDSFFVEGVRRVNSVYGHPNNLGLYMDRIWPLAAALTLWRHDIRDARRVFTYRLFAGISCLLALGGMLVSFSKGSLLGGFFALVVLVFWLPLATRWRRAALAGLGALVVVGLLAAPFVGIERLNPFGESSSIRLSTWASALAMLRDHPIFGIGLDQFGLLYPRYIDPSLAGTNEINTAHPHNLLLDITLRMGILGLIAFGWLIVSTYRRLNRLRQVPNQAYLAAGIAAALTGSIVHGLVDSFYFWPDLAFAFWLFVANSLIQQSKTSA